MNKKILLSIIMMLITSAVLAKGDTVTGDVAKGQEKVKQICQSCHGLDGQGINETYPKLAGQYADYMMQALHDYKSGARKNPIMSGFAAGLTEEDIANVAAYYATLTEKTLHDLTFE